MNTSPTSYFIETQSGKLQLTKGTYLTLLKRKSSVLKTLHKTNPLHTNNKKTIKKHYRLASTHKMLKSLGPNQIVMRDKNRKSLMFSVNQDITVFGGHMEIPLIPMMYDNDNESQWLEIEETKRNLNASVRLAAYDRTYGPNL